MNQFEPALQIVCQSLEQIRNQGGTHRASADALARLAASQPAPQAIPDSRDAATAITPDDSKKAAVTPETAAPVPRETPATGNASRIAPLRDRVLACEKCPHLVSSRTRVVFGVGNPDAELMFVGEAPGADEDLQGEPFVGKAGQLLTKIIEAMGFARDEVYIANVLKCRPNVPPGSTGNRRPTPAEMATCLPYLAEQIEIIRPKILVALGAVAMEGLLGATGTMASLRGRWHDFKGTPLMATYHPAYLLRNQSLGEKRKVWEDMLQVLERLGRNITPKQRGFFLPKTP